MRICSNCGHPISDDAVFCNNCGTRVAAGQPQPQPQSQQNADQGQQAGYNQNQQYTYQNGPQGGAYVPPPADRYDHTGRFSQKEVSEGKVWAMCGYLFGLVGVVIALLASISGRSAYINFHVRQAVKFCVVNVLLMIVVLVLCWTVIIPIAGAVCEVIILVIRIICFFQVCFGKSKEPVIIRSLGFLR